MKRPALVALAAALLVACQDTRLTDPDFGDPLQVIFDGTNPDLDANPRFFFLPPMVDNPAPFIGEPDRDLVPVVSICAGHGVNDCLGNEVLKENASLRGDHYQVNWRTRGVALGDYTVNVRAGKLLGYADVTVQRRVGGNGRGDVFLVKSGRTLPVEFRIEEGALCDPPIPDAELGERECATQTVDLSQGGTVALDIGDEGDGTSSGVDVDPQDGGNITFVVAPCLDENGEPVDLSDLGLDIPVFGDCWDVEALDENGEPLDNQELDNPAIVFACIDFGDLNIGNDLSQPDVDLTFDQAELIRIHRKTDGVVQALPLRDDPCEELEQNASAGSSGLMRFARALGERVFSFIGPRPLHARRRRIDLLHGGAPPNFSQFQWALPATMEKVDGTDNQVAPEGADVANPPAVSVSDALGFPVKGALVTFVNDGNVAVSNPVVTGADGIAAVDSWTLPFGVGEHQVVASGFGIADPDNDGPQAGFDPFTPEPGPGAPGSSPDVGDAVDLDTGSLTFTAFSQVVVGGTNVNVTVDVNNYELTLHPGKLDAATFNSTDLLFNGSISYGNSTSSVLIYNTRTGDVDFGGSGIEVLRPGPVADHQTRTVMSEQTAATTPLGFVVVRETFAFSSAPDDDFVIVKYTLINESGSAVSGLHIGQIIDADVNAALFADDNVEFVSADELVRVTSPGDPPVGFLMLSDNVTSYRAWANPSSSGGLVPVDPSTNAGYFSFLSDGIIDPDVPFGPADIRHTITHGPVTIADGDTRVVAFALLGGTSGADLSANAAAALAKWAALPQGPSLP